LPKARLVALSVSLGVAAFSCRLKLLATEPALAVSVTLCAELTAAIVVLKLALIAPAGRVTVAGTFTALLLLARAMVKLLAVGEVRATVQTSVAAPVTAELEQVNPFSAAAATPVPVRGIVVFGCVGELLAKVSAPLTAPA